LQIPKIADGFHSLEDIGWYVSVYQLASAALQPFTGQTYTKFSTRGVYLVFFTTFLAGSAICGAANSSRILIIGRAVAGMGSGSLMNGTMIILSVIMPKQPGDTVTSLVMRVSHLGIALGSIVGGVFMSSLTGRWCLYVNLPIGAFVWFGLLLIRIPEQIQKKRALEVVMNLHGELDLFGFVLFTPALLMLLLALQFGGRELKWVSPTNRGLFSGSGGLFLVWLVWDWFYGDRALIPFWVMRRRVLWASTLTPLCLMTVVFSAAYFLPNCFQAVKGVTPIMSGMYLLAGIGCQLVSVVISGGLGMSPLDVTP
jgi:MFS family permease